MPTPTPTQSAAPVPTSEWVQPVEHAGRRPRATIFLVGALVLGFVVAAVAAVLEASPVAPIDDGFGTTDAGMAASDLRVGDCFDLEATSAGTITSVTPRACDREHEYELFLKETLSLEAYPTDPELSVFFEEDCIPAFAEYVGASYETSVLDIYWIGPTRQSWRQGDRTFQCAVFHPSIPRLTAPLRDTGPGPQTVPDI